MDPLTALSVASSVLQIVDFGSTVLKQAHQIYVSKDGSTVANSELRDQTKRLRDLCEAQRTQPSSKLRGLSLQEQRLGELCAGCESISEDLLDLLQNITTRNKRGSIMGSLSASLKGMANRRKISSLRARLEERKGLLNLQLLTVLK